MRTMTKEDVVISDVRKKLMTGRKISKELEMQLVALRLQQIEKEMKLKGERYLTEEEAMKKYWEKRNKKNGS